MKTRREIFSLTGLRFVAAFYVFLFHIQIRWPIVNFVFVKNVLDQGAIGMSLFFMLSGFVLAYRYANVKNNYRSYFIHRIARIYPVYFVAAILTLPWIGISFSGSQSIDVAKGIGQGVFLVFTNIFLIQAWFPQFFAYWNDGGSWSISVEAFCYVMLPFILPQLTRLAKRQLVSILVLSTLLAALPGLSAALFNSPSVGVFYSVPIYRLSEFVIGICLHLLTRRYALEGSDFTLLQVSLLGILVGYLGFFGPKMPLYVGHNWIAIPVISFLICSLSNGKGCLSYILSTRTFVWFGKISYCFYSFQAFLLLFIQNKYDEITSTIPLLSNNRLLALVSLILLLIMSSAGYYLIEVPARRAVKSHFCRDNIALQL